MTPLESLTQAQSAYLKAFREALHKAREQDPSATPEVWIKPKPEPGSDETPMALCVDILGGAREEKPSMTLISNGEPPEGALIGTMRFGAVEAKIYPVSWEVFVLWCRHEHPDWRILDPWRRKWLDMERGADPNDEDGLSGVAHYLAPAVAEGGGYLFEADFGSAPLDALTELIEALAQGGATEIELGRSDGSDLDPAIRTELQRPDLSAQRFTELLAQLLGQLEEFERVEPVAPQEISLYRVGNPHAQKVFTNNLFMRLQRVGVEARTKEVYRFVRGQREIGVDDDAMPDLSQLRPVIKDNRFLDNVREQTDGKMSLLARKLVADIWVSCVWDTPNGMRFCSDEEPAKYGLSAEQMHERAVKNYLDDRDEVELTEHGPLLVARTGDSYDATLLLDDNFWREMAGKVEGKVIACVPAREVVLIGGTDARGIVYAMQKAAQQVSEGGDHLITETILQRDGERWTPYAITRPRTSPAGSELSATTKRPWWKFW